MNCKDCRALHWHPNKGFYCTVPNCNPNTTIKDVMDMLDLFYANKHMYERLTKPRGEKK